MTSNKGTRQGGRSLTCYPQPAPNRFTPPPTSRCSPPACHRLGAGPRSPGVRRREYV